MMEYFALVPQGVDLLECLRRTLAGRSIASAIVSLSGGTLERLSYHPASEEPPVKVRGAITLLCANLAFDMGVDGVGMLDCYAAFVDETGISRGGHLAQEPCIAGEGGLLAWISIYDDLRVRKRVGGHTCRPVHSAPEGRPLR